MSKSKKNTYGFKIGKRIINIKAKTEKKALLILCKEYFDLIDKASNIELLGNETAAGNYCK